MSEHDEQVETNPAERFAGKPEAVRVGAVERAIELMEGDAELSATRAAALAGAEWGTTGRSVLRWAKEQGRELVVEGRRAQVSAEAVRTVVYGLRARRGQRVRIVELIERELGRLEGEEEGGDRTAQLQRLATAHKTLTETQHRDELHAMRLGDPDAPVHGVVEDLEDDEVPDNVAAFEEAVRKARGSA